MAPNWIGSQIDDSSVRSVTRSVVIERVQRVLQAVCFHAAFQHKMLCE